MQAKPATLITALFLVFASYGQLRLEDIKVDTTTTGFRLAAAMPDTRIYTRNGEADLATINPSAFSVTIFPGATYQTAKEQIHQIVKMAAMDGYEKSGVIEKDTVINGLKGYYIYMVETLKDEDYKNLTFRAFVIKGNTAVIFMCGDLNNGKYIEKFKQTFYAMKL